MRRLAISFVIALVCSAAATPAAEARVFNRGCRAECSRTFQPVRKAWRVATYPLRALRCN